MEVNGKAILLVEDDFLNRRLSKKILSENGYQVYEAKNAKEAFDVLEKESIALLVLDINLGENEKDGISLGQQIADKFQLPFIYLTAYESSEIVNRAVATAPYSYLTKPFKNVDLIAAVGLAIRQSAGQIVQQPKVIVKDGEYNVEITVDDINHIESDGNYLLVHTDAKSYKLRSTIRQLLELLPPGNFAQVHRAYIINKNKVEKFDKKSVVIKGNIIPTSKNYTE